MKYFSKRWSSKFSCRLIFHWIIREISPVTLNQLMILGKSSWPIYGTTVLFERNMSMHCWVPGNKIQTLSLTIQKTVRTKRNSRAFLLPSVSAERFSYTQLCGVCVLLVWQLSTPQHSKVSFGVAYFSSINSATIISTLNASWAIFHELVESLQRIFPEFSPMEVKRGRKSYSDASLHNLAYMC